MDVKAIEIRDAGTFIPALAIRLNPEKEAERYLLARAGFGTQATDQTRYVLLIALEANEVHYDPISWGINRSRQVAHQHLIDEWEYISSGQVIDVQFILGESDAPKKSEAEGYPI